MLMLCAWQTQQQQCTEEQTLHTSMKASQPAESPDPCSNIVLCIVQSMWTQCQSTDELRRSLQWGGGEPATNSMMQGQATTLSPPRTSGWQHCVDCSRHHTAWLPAAPTSPQLCRHTPAAPAQQACRTKGNQRQHTWSSFALRYAFAFTGVRIRLNQFLYT
jgi:hypothetical protein